MNGTYTIIFTSQTAGPHQLLITMDGERIRNSPYDLKVRASKPDYCPSAADPRSLIQTSLLHSAWPSTIVHGDIFIVGECNCIYDFNLAGVQKAVQGMLVVSSISQVVWLSKEMCCMWLIVTTIVFKS